MPTNHHDYMYLQESKRAFITFHDHKALEPLVTEKWEEFNIKVNTTIPEILQWVSSISQYVLCREQEHSLLAGQFIEKQTQRSIYVLQSRYRYTDVSMRLK